MLVARSMSLGSHRWFGCRRFSRSDGRSFSGLDDRSRFRDGLALWRIREIFVLLVFVVFFVVIVFIAVLEHGAGGGGWQRGSGGGCHRGGRDRGGSRRGRPLPGSSGRPRSLEHRRGSHINRRNPRARLGRSSPSIGGLCFTVT